MKIQKWNKENKGFRFIASLITALIGAILFTYIQTPIPWLLGPMVAVLIGARFGKVNYYWPRYIRDTGLIIVGYSIGLSFTKTALLQILEKLPLMFLMTVILVSFCAGIAYVVSKISGVDYPTILTGSIPGGLNQMIIFAEEIKGIDITTVTFLQVARLLMIIFFVPFLVFGKFFGNGKIDTVGIVQHSFQPTEQLFFKAILFASVCLIFAFLGKKIKAPTPFLLGPILATAILGISGVHGFVLPTSLLDSSQFMIGGYISLLLKPEKLEHKTKIITLALISGVMMIICSLGLSLLLVHGYHISQATSILSLAPGGMDQMGILAHEVNANLSMVTGYQLFRLFFIYFVVPPILKLVFKKAIIQNKKSI
ncbi:AbrB family transcriptional regulator [Neobacillus sp. PS3-40]|uniref:AbrB family transcriptional regulator n=1 Tax=Neobacillus sp. PS3-40 TaxID=3070679 RepID=UPI0027E112A5|nr:AbrB family transcriptional regulator [Neobacillus sp. PS3-40]WML44461.1 AbrB family transcriptional regulator [Neobacillus sp. PS3-40]